MPSARKLFRRTDSGKHEQLRRVDGPATQQDTAPGADLLKSSRLSAMLVLQVRHADDLIAFDQQSRDTGTGDRREIAAVLSRLQVGIGGAVALPTLLRDLKYPDTFLRRAIEILVARVARGDG